MTAAVDRREPIPRRSADSPPSRRRERFKSPPKTSSSRRARSPVSRSRSPSPPKTSSSWRARSPPSRSRSPSSRTKRLRRSQAEREAEKPSEREHSRIEDRDRGRHRGREDRRDEPSERREARGRNDGGSSRPPRRECSASPEEQRSRRGGHGSQSPPRAARAGPRDEVTKSRAAELWDGEDDSVAKLKAAEEALEAKDKQKPSFELSGKLAEETNRVRGVTLLFTEPPDARKPDIRWRLYVFKAGEVLKDPLYVHRQSCYLFGRERRVADIPTDHPSCSKQHAVIQYRLVEQEQPDGLLSKQVRPYLMDLGSTNGTFINDNRIEPQRYYELFEKDTIKFGNSSREYVLLHENSTE